MVRYKMLGLDVNSSPLQYRTWVVENEPDLTGALYTGYKAGDTPLVNISAYAILDDAAVVDFNLPKPTSWACTNKTLPKEMCASQLAIIGDFVYLFGSRISDKIYKAPVNDPTIWEDTGAVLPTALYSSQLAIINDIIYLFGGNSTTGSVDTIFSASVSDPLTWTNNGSLLPKKLSNSQLGIIDGYVYLFGGTQNNIISDVILRASADDPLTWIDTGGILPVPLSNSHFCIIGDYSFLFGGLIGSHTATDAIYYTNNNNPVTWYTLSGTLPFPVANGQFFAVGERGYLIAPPSPTIPGASFSKILQCELLAPSEWRDSLRTVPGSISQSQLAIIYDKLFLFGGNGSSIIFSCNSSVKYSYTNTTAVDYGNVTRTVYDNTLNTLDLFKVLGFPNWKTDYGNIVVP